MMLARKERDSEKQRSFMLKCAIEIAVDLESMKTRLAYLQRKNGGAAEEKVDSCRRK